MRYISLLILILASCSGATTAVQVAASPYHLSVTTEGAVTIDANAAGLGLCASADVAVGVYRVDGESSPRPLGEWRHAGQAGAVAYEIEHGEDGWAAYQLAPDVGAKRYPRPFQRCATSSDRPAALHSPPSGRLRKWHETSAPASEQ